MQFVNKLNRITMETKIAVLRGINVGGKRKLPMGDLKSMLMELGYTAVTTYIQSGNVLFKSDTDSTELEGKLEKSIKDKFNYDVPVVVRSVQELGVLINTNPFYTTNSDINKLHLTFLKEQPSAENKKLTESISSEPDKFSVTDKDTFIFCEGKYHQSKLTNNFFEKKLKVGATTRNWKTTLKLYELGEKF